MTQTDTTDVTPKSSTETTPTFTTSGRVKWFNNKAGYGFITVSAGEHSGSDVFVHHSAITVDHEQYRYLVQGEYVNFDLCKVDDENHSWQAGTVKGINGGKLMCETRLESRESRVNRGEGERRQPRNTVTLPREDNTTHSRVRTRGPGPRDGDEWMLVRRRPRTPYNGSTVQHDVLRTRQPKTNTGGEN
tara:strand:- start:623 stop:1189 length:567 start_codon:yes stop_codon:yes gene_type:complete